MEPLKVSSKSAPNAVAGAIAGVIRESLAAQNCKPWVLALQIKRSKQSLLPAAISPLPGSILSVSRLLPA